MVINTTRFSNIQFNENDLINFPEGILGFADLKNFVLLDDPNDDIFAWLQSTEEPAIAFPVLEPELFTDSYKINLTKSDLETLQLKSLEGSRLFSIVTIPEDPTQMTANIKAPIVINIEKRLAKQCVLQDNQLAIRQPIFAKLQARVVSQPQKSIKEQSNNLDVAIKLSKNTESDKQI